MIQKDYVLIMARYNSWQNNQLRGIVKSVDEIELKAERGAFFGSIFATMNHILWGDTRWMSRFCSDVSEPAAGSVHTEFTPTVGAWDAERFRLDGRMRIWAQTLSNLELRNEISWIAGDTQQRLTQPLGVCVMHMFNHQTHHRGQISQMLNAAGYPTAVSDLVYLPKDA